MDAAQWTQLHHDRLQYAGAQHPKMKQIRHIIDNSKPNPHKLFILEGIWAHQTAQECGLAIQSFVVCPEMLFSPEAFALADRYLAAARDTYVVSEKVMERIAEFDKPNGLISIAEFPKWMLLDVQLEATMLVLVMDGIEIPGNIGTILRSADATGAAAVFVVNRRARLTHPMIIRASMGASFMLPIIELDTEELQKWLLDNHFTVYLTDTRAEKRYFELEYEGRVAIVAGSERYGITKGWYEEKHVKASIPMLGRSDSLNVGVATTLFAYEASMRQKGFIQNR